MSLHADNPYRFIAILGALQIMAVLLAWFLATAAIKVQGYPDSASAAQMPQGLLALRNHGWAFLSVPLAWVVLGFLSKRRDSPFWEGPFAYLTGYALLLFLILFCVMAGAGIFMITL